MGDSKEKLFSTVKDKGKNQSSGLFENKIEKRWFTTNECAVYLGRTVGAVRNLVYRGILLPKKFGGRHYFDKKVLDRAIETSKEV